MMCWVVKERELVCRGGLDLLKAIDRLKLLHHVERVLVAKEAPDDGNVLDDDHERYGAHGA